MDCEEVETGYRVSYTPTVPGDYFVTVKYNGGNVEGSPFKVTAYGGGAAGTGGKFVGHSISYSFCLALLIPCV
jgi:filamin